MLRYLIFVAVLASLSGCNSFRTIILDRHADDSVSVQNTHRRLNGLPVKLKVPSHVHVVIYEQQIILANSNELIKDKKDKANETAAAAAEQEKKLKALINQEADATAKIKEYDRSISEITKLKNAAQAANDTNAVKAYDKRLDALNTSKVAEQERLAQAKTPEHSAAIKKESDSFDDMSRNAALAAEDATIKYTLLSFNPPQFIVETELQYTDKVFLVDFKRPAGGILDLKEASLDDEQYFSKIKAEVEERTMADISTALQTVKEPLASAFKSKTNVAVATSADTPEAEANDHVNFQKSVVATKRFDISEPGWECELDGFVNLYLTEFNVSAPLDSTAPGKPDDDDGGLPGFDAIPDKSGASIQALPIIRQAASPVDN